MERVAAQLLPNLGKSENIIFLKEAGKLAGCLKNMQEMK